MENTTQITEQDYQSLLDRHDWAYQYSDDHRVLLRESEESNKLHELKKDRPELEALFNSKYEAMKIKFKL